MTLKWLTAGYENDDRRRHARAYALARDWCDVTPTDLRSVPLSEDLYAGARWIGNVTVRGSDDFEAKSSLVSGRFGSRAEAIDALIAAENARRAKERTDG